VELEDASGQCLRNVCFTFCFGDHFVSGQYEDMKADLGAAVHAVAKFLQVDLTEAEARTSLGRRVCH
jgi:hypothetical protein